MSLTAIGRAALVGREALKTHAYKDSVGIWTIGVGHTSAAGAPKVTAGLVISEAEALEIFSRDLAKFETTVDQAVKVPLADHERDALVSICFNIGQGGFAKSTFVKRLNEGNRAACAAAIMSWLKPPELLGRRTAERDQFLTPYSATLPKARSEDRSPVKVGIAITAPSKPKSDRMSIPAGKWAEDTLPAFEIRAIQEQLDRMGYKIIGVPDGIWGDRTTAAIKALQEQASRRDPTIVPDGHYGVQTKGLLADPVANKAEVSAVRGNATAGDLAKIGTPGVVQGRRIQWASVFGILGALATAAYTAWQTPADMPLGSSIFLAFLPPPVAAILSAIGPFLLAFIPLAYTAVAGGGLVETSVKRFQQGIDNTGLPPANEPGSRAPAAGGLFGNLFGGAR